MIEKSIMLIHTIPRLKPWAIVENKHKRKPITNGFNRWIQYKSK